MDKASNVAVEVEGNIMTIKVDLTKDFGPSSTGKSRKIASTGGFMTVPGAGNEKKFLSLNVNSDSRHAVIGSLNASYSTNPKGGWGSNLSLGAEFRPTSSVPVGVASPGS